ncbi:ABC transporter permease subunit [Candidatus Latescibacterota bacterium]
MLFTIFRRELLDHLMSVRFALSVALTVALMALNGVLFAGGEFGERMTSWRDAVKHTADHVETKSGEGLAELGIRGPGWLVKQPSPLVLCASGRDEFLPPSIDAFTGSTTSSSRWDMKIHMPWFLRYSTPPRAPDAGVLSDFAEIDWVFAIGFAMSLMALLLTYDGICGERESGTLRLLLSGPVPRFAVLAGKFLAALAVLSAALVAGVAINLLIISLFGAMELTAALGWKVLAMATAAVLYLAFFVAMGLLVSARAERPAASLVSLLLIWTVLLVLLPNTTAGVVSYLGAPKLEHQERHDAVEALWEEHQIDRQQSPVGKDEHKPYEYVKVFTDYVQARLRVEQQYEEEFLRRQLAPVELGRSLNRASPYGVFQYAMESLADTGLPRHRRFMATAREYEKVFRQFVFERDQAEADSYHLFGMHDGMSTEPVPVEVVPVFGEDLSAGRTIGDTAPDLALLGLFALAALMGANVAFLRREIT